jgi:hypothetical protein
MAPANHPVGDDRRQQRLHTGEKGNGEGTREQLAGALDRDIRERQMRQLGRYAAKSATDRLDGKAK